MTVVKQETGHRKFTIILGKRKSKIKSTAISTTDLKEQGLSSNTRYPCRQCRHSKANACKKVHPRRGGKCQSGKSRKYVNGIKFRKNYPMMRPLLEKHQNLHTKSSVLAGEPVSKEGIQSAGTREASQPCKKRTPWSQ